MTPASRARRPRPRLRLRSGAVRLLVAIVLAVAGAGCAGDRSKPAAGATVAIWGSSSAERMAGESGLSAVLGVPVFNGGVGGQQAAHIDARQGSAPAQLLPEAGQPAPDGSVAVTTRSFSYRTDIEIVGTVDGVHGVLRSQPPTGYLFTPDRSAEPPALTGPAPLISDDSLAHQDAVTLLWLGKNDIKAGSWATAIRYTKAAWSYAGQHSGKVLVLGHFADTDMTPGSVSRAAFDRVEAEYADAYGSSFLDVQAYLDSPRVWTDLDLTATASDLAAQRQGTLPPSLDDGSHRHLTTAAYRAVAVHLVKPALVQRRWIP